MVAGAKGEIPRLAQQEVPVKPMHNSPWMKKAPMSKTLENAEHFSPIDETDEPLSPTGSLDAGNLPRRTQGWKPRNARGISPVAAAAAVEEGKESPAQGASTGEAAPAVATTTPRTLAADEPGMDAAPPSIPETKSGYQASKDSETFLKDHAQNDSPPLIAAAEPAKPSEIKSSEETRTSEPAASEAGAKTVSGEQKPVEPLADVSIQVGVAESSKVV